MEEVGQRKGKGDMLDVIIYILIKNIKKNKQAKMLLNI